MVRPYQVIIGGFAERNCRLEVYHFLNHLPSVLLALIQKVKRKYPTPYKLRFVLTWLSVSQNGTKEALTSC